MLHKIKRQCIDNQALTFFNALFLSAKCQQKFWQLLGAGGCFFPAHMPSTRSLTVYMNGIPIHTNTSEYVYTVENGRLATCQENEGSSFTFHWGMMK